MEQGLNKVLPSERMSTNTIPHSSELGQTCPSGYHNPSAPTRETELAKRRAECLPGFVIWLREARPPASAALAQVCPGNCEVTGRIFGPYDGHDCRFGPEHFLIHSYRWACTWRKPRVVRAQCPGI